MLYVYLPLPWKEDGYPSIHIRHQQKGWKRRNGRGVTSIVRPLSLFVLGRRFLDQATREKRKVLIQTPFLLPFSSSFIFLKTFQLVTAVEMVREQKTCARTWIIYWNCHHGHWGFGERPINKERGKKKRESTFFFVLLKTTALFGRLSFFLFTCCYAIL
jgi:hypothetical protein